MLNINQYMKIKNLPKDLQSKVRKYHEYIYENQEEDKGFTDDHSFLNLLSKQLKEEVTIIVK